MVLESECHPGQPKVKNGYCMSTMNDNILNPDTDHRVYAKDTPAQHL